MQDSAKHLVFAIPELVALIAQYLSPHDTSQWMMTCKAISHQLAPYFWRHPVLRRNHQAPKSLARYTYHFQSLDVSLNKAFEFVMEDLPIPTFPTPHALVASAVNVGFPRLKKLTISTPAPDNIPTSLLLILYHSPNLTELSIQRPFKLNPPLIQLFLIVLTTQLPCLQRLSIQPWDIKSMAVFELLEACLNHPQLTDLQCEFQMGHGAYDPWFTALLKCLEDADKAKEDAGRPTGSRLKSLMLPDIRDGYPKEFIIPFLRSHVPNLEQLRFPKVRWLVNEMDIQELEEAIAIGCPKLQHLSGSCCVDEEDYCMAIIATIRSCAGLKSFVGYDEEHPEIGSVVKNLLEYHAGTLEKIEFLEGGCVSSDDIHSIVTRCKNLRTLRMNPDDGPTPALRFQAVSVEWVCRDITVLDILVDREVTVPQGRNKIDIVIQSAQRFFAQVGRLTKLEELSLGCKECLEDEDFTKDLTLEYGWLGELAGLKQLRHLRMHTDYWSPMSHEDVEFMNTSWPKLEKISFGWGGYDRDEDHWEWLRERRPHIVFV
ncbi:hypothetical protein BGX34_003169 [Mortierella sp. NVP85]|nr:hypothetical protein BGX34_003169 [Mortierella sp. NVP85]